ncbi:MAG TPA: hypothetical protein VHW24_13640 [Bryobacteraceae bacterium]|nr:hypothetical protein [Bryobacteraceae bacterium]
MRIILLTFLVAIPLHAADELKAPLQSAADAAFQRVVTAPVPNLDTAVKCMQAEAMLFAVAAPEETPLVAFRRAYCTLDNAAAAHDSAAFETAAEAFDDAIANAQGASAKQKSSQSLAPVNREAPSAWRVLAAVARLNGGASLESQEKNLEAAVDGMGYPDCQSYAGTPNFCQGVKQLGSAWLGRIALSKDDLTTAARRFDSSDAKPWKDFVAGVQSFERRNYSDAVEREQRAIIDWRATQQQSLLERISPQPSMTDALTDWGGAQLASGNTSAALTNLDAAIKLDGANGRALYLRGVAKQRSGRSDAAADDFNLASRAALAKASDTGSAEAHFYRGVALFARKEFARAEDEFSSAMNTDSESRWQADARAWRLLAAVNAGACGASRESLLKALAGVSPFFPRNDATASAGACPTTAAVFPAK